MKILLICYDIHPLKGGESSVAWNIATRLAQFVEVTIITRPNNIQECSRAVEEQCLNIMLTGYDLSQFFTRLKNRLPGGIFLYCTLWQYFLAKKLKRNTNYYDIVHSVNFVSDTIACFIYKLDNRTIWGPISHHEPMPFELTNFFSYIKMQLKLFVRKGIWSVLLIRNKKQKFDLVLHSNKSVSNRLGTGVNVKYWPSTGVVKKPHNKKRLNVENNQIKLVYAARMTEIKGWSIILNLIKELSIQNSTSHVHFDLIGDGPLLPKIMKFLHKQTPLKVTWKVHGRLSHARYQEVLAQSNVYVCPSFEGGGIAVAEAMSVGLPVVCFDNYGPGETVGSDYAGLVKVRQNGKFVEEDFFNTVIQIIEDVDFRNKVAKQSLERVDSVLDWDVKVRKLFKLYCNLVNVMK